MPGPALGPPLPVGAFAGPPCLPPSSAAAPPPSAPPPAAAPPRDLLAEIQAGRQLRKAAPAATATADEDAADESGGDAGGGGSGGNMQSALLEALRKGAFVEIVIILCTLLKSWQFLATCMN